MDNLKTASLLLAVLTAGCVFQDDNAKPVFGADHGLPVNCRAYVQVAIDGFRSSQYSATEAMAGLERNCGAYGQLWKDNR